MRHLSVISIVVLSMLVSIAGCTVKPDSSEIIEVFDRHSYRQVNRARLMKQFETEGFAALPSFDENASYYPKSWLPSVPTKEDAKDNAGLGLVMWRVRKSLVYVVSVFKGSPAYLAGIRAGDSVTHINDIQVSRLTDMQIQNAIYGEPGGLCRLRGKTRNGGMLQASIRREFGGMPIAWGFKIPGTKLGYVRIISFTKKATSLIRSAMNDVLDDGATHVILDLRSNRAGSLAELSTVLSYFAPGGGKLFSSSSRHKGYSNTFFSKLTGSYYGIPYTILTNSETSSRGEIFAQTLKEWGGGIRTITAGERTAGDTSVTRGFTLKNGGVLRITVSKLFPPSNKDLDNVGIAPEMPVKLDADVDRQGMEYPAALASFDGLLTAAIKGLN